MSKPIFLTEEGLAALEQELEDLKSVKRKEIAEKIKVALSFGDLSENSEYDEAKNDQAIVEARIADIEVMLKNVQVIDESELGTENIHIGSKVEVKVTAVKNGESSIKEYRIVGSNEANPKAGRISDESLIGKSLLGHTVGDKVEVEVEPVGIIEPSCRHGSTKWVESHQMVLIDGTNCTCQGFPNFRHHNWRTASLSGH